MAPQKLRDAGGGGGGGAAAAMGAEVAGGGALRGHNLAAKGRPRSQKSLQVRPSLAWVTEVINEQEESQTENGDGPGSGIPESSHGPDTGGQERPDPRR